MPVQRMYRLKIKLSAKQAKPTAALSFDTNWNRKKQEFLLTFNFVPLVLLLLHPSSMLESVSLWELERRRTRRTPRIQMMKRQAANWLLFQFDKYSKTLQNRCITIVRCYSMLTALTAASHNLFLAHWSGRKEGQHHDRITCCWWHHCSTYLEKWSIINN